MPVVVTLGNCIIITSAIRTDANTDIGLMMFMRVLKIYYQRSLVPLRLSTCTGRHWKNYSKRMTFREGMRFIGQKRSWRDLNSVNPTFIIIYWIVLSLLKIIRT
jgi:hypothetical protein